MTRHCRLKSAVVSTVVATAGLVFPSSASTATMVLEGVTLDADPLVRGLEGALELEFRLRNNLDAGRSGVVHVEIELPEGGVNLLDLDPRPLMVSGKLSWTSMDAPGTELFLADYEDLSFLERQTLTLVPNTVVPESHDFCGIYGLDMHPDTGVYWVVFGAGQRDTQDCDDPWDGMTDGRRYLGTLNPYTGLVTPIGQMTWWTRNLAFLPDGTLLAIEGWANGPTPGMIHEVDKASGALSPWHMPESSAGNNFSSGALAWHPEDGRLWYMNPGSCDITAIDTATKDEMRQDTSYCSGIDTGLRWFRDGEFFFQEEDSLYRQSYDTGASRWQSSYMGRFPDYMRDWVFAGNWHNDVSCHPLTPNLLRCTFADIVPWGAWAVRMELGFTPQLAGPDELVVRAWREANVGQLRSESINVDVLEPVDLTVKVAPTGKRYQPGEALTYSIEVANRGEVDADDVDLDITFPAKVTPVTPSGGGFTCGAMDGNRVVSCSRGALAAGASAVLTYTATAGAAGVAELRADVSTSSYEPLVANNHAFSRLVFGGAVDLRLSFAEIDGVLDPGDSTTVVATVRNLGPDAASSVQMDVWLPAELSVSSPDCDAVSDEPRLICDLGNLTVDDSIELTFSATAGDLGGFFSIVGEVEAAAPPELTPDNNRAEAAVPVRAPGISVALGSVNANGMQLALTHNGGEQDLKLKSMTLAVDASVGGISGSAMLRVVLDRDADGRAGSGEPTFATGVATLVDGETRVVFSRAIEIPAGETVHILLIPTRIERVAVDAASVLPMLAPFVFAGLLAFRRRRALAVLPLLLVAGSLSLAGCSETVDTTVPPQRTVQISVTDLEISAADRPSPPSSVSGLPLEGPRFSVR